MEKVHKTWLPWKILKKPITQVTKVDRNDLSRDRTRENNDPQTILVSI